MLTDALGPSDRHVTRFHVVSLQRTTGQGYRLTVRWAINNDLSAGTVANGAQADAYLVFSDIFSLKIPFQRVTLLGTYPSTATSGEKTVMRLWMDRKTARTIAMYGWTTVDAQTLWPLIHRPYVAADFQPVPME